MTYLNNPDAINKLHRFYAVKFRYSHAKICADTADYRKMSITALRGTKVALLACGSFNPPTFMHLRMFERARDFLEKDCGSNVVEGIISPVADNFAKPELLSARHRLRMAELAVSSSSWIRADGWECQRTEWSRTLLVLKHHREELQRKYAFPVRLMLLCGADVVDSFVRILPNGRAIRTSLPNVHFRQELVGTERRPRDHPRFRHRRSQSSWRQIVGHAEVHDQSTAGHARQRRGAGGRRVPE